MGKSTSVAEALKGRDFICTQEWTREELEYVLDLAAKLKENRFSRALANKTLVSLFFNPSLRTQASAQMAMAESGGSSLVLHPGRDTWEFEHREGAVMDGKFAEHVKEVSRVLSRFIGKGNGAIGVRAFAKKESWEEDRRDALVRSFAEYADVPVINLESAVWHPLQELADIMTIREHLGNPRGKKFVLSWAYHPSPLPMAVPNSAALIASRFGMDVVIARPPGFDLDPEITDMIGKNCEENGARLEISDDQNGAIEGAHIVYAKSWGAIAYYGRWEEEKKVREKFREWRITAAKMDRTDRGKFMHCLPVRRNVVVDDEVIDGRNSIVYDQAENRLHTIKAVLQSII